MSEEKIYAKGFKGFDPGMKCLNKQYAKNTVFEEEGGEICHEGVMHFCENPLDVLGYYPLLNDDCEFNEFATVEALAEVETEGNKSASRKLKIGVKLDLKGFVEAAVNFSLEWLKKVDFTSRNGSQLAAAGDGSQLAAAGGYSKLAASGDFSQLAASGDKCVIASLGYNGRVKGALGCFIACAEWAFDDGNWVPVSFLSAKVDGKKIKADTWYTVKNGKFVEVKDE